MSSLSDKLRILDVNESITLDVLEGIGFTNPTVFKKTLEAKTHLLQSRVTNKQRLHKDIQDRQFSAKCIDGISMDEDGNLCRFVKITRLA